MKITITKGADLDSNLGSVNIKDDEYKKIIAAIEEAENNGRDGLKVLKLTPSLEWDEEGKLNILSINLSINRGK